MRQSGQSLDFSALAATFLLLLLALSLSLSLLIKTNKIENVVFRRVARPCRRNAVVLITQMLFDRNFRFILITIVIDKRVFMVEDPFIPCVGDYTLLQNLSSMVVTSAPTFKWTFR